MAKWPAGNFQLYSSGYLPSRTVIDFANSINVRTKTKTVFINQRRNLERSKITAHEVMVRSCSMTYAMNVTAGYHHTLESLEAKEKRRKTTETVI